MAAYKGLSNCWHQHFVLLTLLVVFVTNAQTDTSLSSNATPIEDGDPLQRITSDEPKETMLPSIASKSQEPAHLDPGPISQSQPKPRPVHPNTLPELTEQEGGSRGNKLDRGRIYRYPPESPKGENGAMHHNSSTCSLSTVDPEVYTKVKNLVDGGAKLLEYEIGFPEYEVNPLLVNMKNNFKAFQWSRAFTKHGRTLLSLNFNYRELSLSMLSFGVEHVSVEIVDSPQGCFGNYSTDEKIHKIMEVVMSDFRSEIQDPQWVGDFDYACHEVIEDDSGTAAFEYKCYERLEEGNRIHVKENQSIKWVKVLFILIMTLKVFVFLTGPTVLSSSFKKFEYEVELMDPLFKTLVATRTAGKSRAGKKGELDNFPKFKRKLGKLPEDEVQLISLRKLHIDVDHRRLMTEKSVPVGLLRFLYQNIVFCGIRRWEPFVTCCAESVLGSWSPSFLWMRLKDHSNEHGKEFLQWKHIFRLLGGVFMLLALPLPYYIRIVIFHFCEKTEINARKHAADGLGLRYPWDHTLIHYVDPSHPAMISIYCIYGLSFIILAMVRSCNRPIYEPVVMGAVCDMGNVRMTECFRLMVAHFLLPFEKFGCCGIIIWAIYWPLVMVLCLIVSICYCTPTLYLFGRFLIQSRTRFLRNYPKPTTGDDDPYHKLQTLTKGTASFENALLLENVSEGKANNTEEKLCSCSTKQGEARCIAFMIGILCCILMLSVLFLFVDVLGFIVEVLVFTLMGSIVNASKASKFVMLFFWILIYASACFNNVYKKYMKLNGHIFKVIKNKLEDRIKDVTVLAEETQKNVAFKYFSHDNLKELQDTEVDAVYDDDSDDDNDPYLYYSNTNLEDGLTRKHQKLTWRVHNLVMFLDRYDIPHIPRDLFYDICDLEGPGYPGPVHKSLVGAFKQLSYMTMFLAFVVITVMTFGDAYQISSTNQLMVTLAGGFIPFMIRTVIKPKTADLNLNSYSFEAKLHQIIYRFSERWPVSDIAFKMESKEEVMVMPADKSTPAKQRGPFNPPAIPFIDGANNNDDMYFDGRYYTSSQTQTGVNNSIEDTKTSTFNNTSTQTPMKKLDAKAEITVDLKRRRILVTKMKTPTSVHKRRKDIVGKEPQHQKLREEDVKITEILSE